jgi:HSP20 family protein
MTLVKFNQPLAKSFDNLLEGFWNDALTPNLKGDAPVNISETKDAYKLDFSVPGRAKEDFNVSIDRNLLTVSYEKKQEEKEENEKRIRREYSFESFKRSFTLDEKIDADKISAKYENGILSLELPKKEEVKINPKTVEIK